MGVALFWGHPSEEQQYEEGQPTEQDEGSVVEATPVAFRAVPDRKLAAAEPSAVASCFDAFFVLFCSLLVVHLFGNVDFGYFLGPRLR